MFSFLCNGINLHTWAKWEYADQVEETKITDNNILITSTLRTQIIGTRYCATCNKVQRKVV